MLSYTQILSIIFKIIIYAGIVQGIYSSIVLTHTRLKNPANQYLAILLAILSFCILHSTFIVPYFGQFHKVSFQIKEPFILLVVPFIWLYVKKLNEPTFRFRKKHLLHYVPFIIVMLFSFLYLARHREFTAEVRFHSHAAMLGIVIYILALGQFIFYLYYIFRLIRNFRSKALNELSNTENIDPAWLTLFLVIFLAVFVLLIMMMIIAIHRIDVSYFNNVVSIVFAFAIYILGYKGLFQQTILPINNNIDVKEIQIEENLVPENKVIDERLLNKLNEFMINQKPYHDPELTLTSLASQVEISRNLLSELINSGTGGNFYDYVNKFRVEEVKALMSNIKYKDYTILAIAFEAGFPSKSTFNSVFKKHTGFTPSEYRNSI